MRGLIRFSAGGHERSIQFTTNRLCDLEEETGQSVMHLAESLGQPGAVGLRDVRRLLRVGMGTTDADAGEVIDQIGLAQSVDLVGRALAAAFDIPVEGGKPAASAGKKAAGAV